MSDQPPPDTTHRVNDATFSGWTFDTGLPDQDVLQRMCAKAAAFAVKELLKDCWLTICFSDDRNAEIPNRLEVCFHSWDDGISVGRPLAELLDHFAWGHAYGDGAIDDDNADVVELIKVLEASVAMLKARMQQR